MFLVADGMGGYEAGDRASAAVVSAFRGRLVDRDLRVVELEGDALERSGWARDEFLGHRLPDVLGPERAKPLTTLLERAFAGHPGLFEAQAESTSAAEQVGCEDDVGILSPQAAAERLELSLGLPLRLSTSSK